MGMNTYPFEEAAAFFIYGEAAKIIWKQVFSDEEFDPAGISDLGEQFDALWSHSYAGKVESLFPELTNNPLDLDFDDGEISIIACDKEPDLFVAPYADKESLVEEFKQKLADKGVTMPDDFDWWRYIVKVTGTDFS